MRAAAVQLNSTDEYDRNLEVAERLVRAAAADGAELVVLSEKWTVLGPLDAIRASAEPLDGVALSAAAGWARELGVFLVAGSVPEAVPDQEKLANTSVMFGPGGERLATYRKIHLFDVDVPGAGPLTESAATKAGQDPSVTEVRGVKLGMTVCYDVRFPELFTKLTLSGARIITVPAAFTLMTGKDHWHVLLRARAIENEVFVVAPAQAGKHPRGRHTYGKSLIVDPWGDVIAQVGGSGEGVAVAKLDFAHQDEVRRALPCLSHKKIHIA
jgi:predicted amidohydrolase